MSYQAAVRRLAFIVLLVSAEICTCGAARATPIPVVIYNKELVFADSGWTIGVAVGTGLLALFTFYLAFVTQRLANTTAISTQDENKRQRNSLTAHLAIVKQRHVVTHRPIGGNVIKQDMGGYDLHVRNIGLGPALNVEVLEQPSASECMHVEELPPGIAVDDKYPVVLGIDPNKNVRLRIRYEDIFKRGYFSVFQGQFNDPHNNYNWTPPIEISDGK